eukprot:3792225-Rhodomonas_salina.1
MSGTVRRDAHEHPTSSFVCSACDMPVPPNSLGRSYLNTGTTTGGDGPVSGGVPSSYKPQGRSLG